MSLAKSDALTWHHKSQSSFRFISKLWVIFLHGTHAVLPAGHIFLVTPSLSPDSIQIISAQVTVLVTGSPAPRWPPSKAVEMVQKRARGLGITVFQLLSLHSKFAKWSEIMLGVLFSIHQFTVCGAAFGVVIVIEINYMNKLDSQTPLYFILSNMNIQIDIFISERDSHGRNTHCQSSPGLVTILAL